MRGIAYAAHVYTHHYEQNILRSVDLSSLLGVGTGNENKKLGKDWNTDNIDLMSFSSDYPKIHLIFINISAIIICNYNMSYLRQ